MTREEIINQGRPTEPNCFETDREEQWYNVGLYDGATAIHWHSVADGDLPPRATGQYSNLVIILNEDEEMRLDYYDWKKHDWFSRSKNNDFNVIHWMEIPQLPKESEI